VYGADVIAIVIIVVVVVIIIDVLPLQTVASLQSNGCVTFKLCLLTYKCLHGLAPDYLSRFFCTLLTSVPGRPLLRSADAEKLLVPRSCTASFGLRSFGSSGPTAWNDMSAHLRNLDLSLSDFRHC